MLTEYCDEDPLSRFQKELEDTLPTNGEHHPAPPNGIASPTAAAVIEQSNETHVTRSTFLWTVKVNEPKKHVTPFETFLTYQIQSEHRPVHLAASDYTVRRRYTDFLWLFKHFEENYPFSVLPPLPEKQSWSSLDRFNLEFARKRMISLDLFLRRAAEHSKLCEDEYLNKFLTLSEHDFSAFRKQSTRLLSWLTESLPSSSAVRAEVPSDSELAAAQLYLQTLSDRLAAVDRINGEMATDRRECLNETQQLHSMMDGWCKLEEDNVSQFIGVVAGAVDKCATAQKKALDGDEEEVQMPVKDYVAYTETIKASLRRCNGAIADGTAAVETKKNWMTEYRAWSKTKDEEVRVALWAMAARQVDMYRSCTSAWEEALKAIRDLNT